MSTIVRRREREISKQSLRAHLGEWDNSNRLDSAGLECEMVENGIMGVVMVAAERREGMGK